MASPATGSTKPKRYLRAVLRPEEWEDYDLVVIEQLGRKAEAKLHQSLTTVRGFHPEFKTGRKSHAQHAISFLEYLLHKVKTEACHVCGKISEFACKNCSKHFHVDCVRPSLEAVPAEGYVCAYCLVDQSEGRPKRHLSSAVAQMDKERRKREDHQEEEKKEDQPKQEDQKDGESKEEDTKEKKTEEQEDEASSPEKKKRNMELYNLADSLSPPASDNMDEAGRTKRPRRQVRTYNPQDGPARRWQSDEPKEWNDTDSDSSSSTSGSSSEDEEEQAPKQGGEVRCIFCHDHRKVTVCCFCACRVCFGKRHSRKLLACQECGGRYHQYCLDPQLKTVPKSWSCPDCRKSTRRGSPGEKRPVGRPRRFSPTDMTPLVPRKRGRPRLDQSSSPASKKGRLGSGNTPEEVKVSRSGRPVKRSTFHDEIEEGDQHLKTNRLATFRPKPKTPASQKAKSSTTSTKGTLTSSSTSSAQRKPNPSAPTPKATPVLQGNSPLKTPEILKGKPSFSSPTAPNAAPGSIPVAPLVNTSVSPDPLVNAVTHKIVPPAPKPPPAKPPAAPVTATPAPAATAAGTKMTDSNSSSPVPSAATTAAQSNEKTPRRKPGARECVQISRRFGVRVIPETYMEILTDYCQRGKVDHLIRMRERLDDHSRFLELQLATLESLVKKNGESDVVVPAIPPGPDKKLERTMGIDPSE